MFSEHVAPFGYDVFAEMNQLAAKYQAINLGQGAPEEDGPDEIKQAAIRAIREDSNQYPNGKGVPMLRQAIAEHARRFYGQKVDPEDQITVTNGATESLFAALLGLVSPGEEVILFEPWYDIYPMIAHAAGGRVRPVPLYPPDWHFDREELATACNEQTRLILINTPHNPTGKVFSRDELSYIAELCRRWNLIVVTDEVYEHLVYQGKHVRIATLPGMEQRTVTISSIAKTFSFTGWKIGWSIAARPLQQAIRRVHQIVTFAIAAPLQTAAITGLRFPDHYYTELLESYRTRRDFICPALADLGLEVYSPQGSFYVMVNFQNLGLDALGVHNAQDFCQFITRELGVAAIPPLQAFYSREHQHLGRYLTRFSFCKTRSTLKQAIERLQGLRAYRDKRG